MVAVLSLFKRQNALKVTTTPEGLFYFMIQEKVNAEVQKAFKNYGHFNSTHEGYAVLKEEVDELWKVIKKNTERHYGTSEWKTKALIPELIQIAAVAQRMATELENNKIKFV